MYLAKIICTKDEYDKLSTILMNNTEFLANINIFYDIVEESPTIPKDYLYDTETNEFYVYRHKYTGDEIHIVKEPSIYLIKE